MTLPKIDLTGRRFGRVVVLGLSSTRRGQHIDWNCRCDCGTEWPVTGPNLRSGNTKSCGCYKPDATRVAKTKHGMSPLRGQKHPIYVSWRNMRARCEKVTNRAYKDYGGRGIAVCDRWRNFSNFFADMGEAWRPGLQIERRNNDGGYERDNCYWAPPIVQANNKRNNRWIETPRGKMTVAQASREFSVDYNHLQYLAQRGRAREAFVA